MNYEVDFNRKVEQLHEHSAYPMLRARADQALRLHTGWGYEAIAAAHFIDTILVMPPERIRRWLDGDDRLIWSELDHKRYEAMKGGYMDIQERYPDYTLHVIGQSNLPFWTDALGFSVITEFGSFPDGTKRIIIGKKLEKGEP